MRIRAALRWTALVITIVISGWYVTSLWWDVRVVHATYSWFIFSASGCVGARWGMPAFGGGNTAEWTMEPRAQPLEWWPPDYAVGWFVLPLWMPLLLSATATTILWWQRARERPVPPIRMCHACGYALTGLPTGSPCPECGEAAGARA